MDVLGKVIGIRLFIIALLTFILMRIFYIYFHKYLDLQYIHFPSNVPALNQNNKSPQTSIASSLAIPPSHSLSDIQSALNRSNSLNLMLRKSPKYGFHLRSLNGSRSSNPSRNNSFLSPYSRKKSSRLSKKPLYEEWENVLQRQEVTWEEFVAFPRQPPRSKLNIPTTAITSLRRCEERRNDSFYNSSTIVKKGCNDIWNDNYVSMWKSRKVKGLCDDNASSKIHCYDSSFKTRFCVFENTMLNFKKMRKRKQDSSITRVFEKGFLASDCGETAPEDINYYQLYTPDIEHKDDFPCDFVFNETVVLYSHENIRHVGSMMSDYLNLWMMLYLSGLSRYSKDITLLNMDHFIAPHHNNRNHRKEKTTQTLTSSTALDTMNQFFKNYNISFRRIIKASDLMSVSSASSSSSSAAPVPPRVCIKRLLLPPKPLLNFHWDVKETHDPSNRYECPSILMSSLLQRWNLQIRNHYHLFSSSASASASSLASNPTSTTMSDLSTNRQMKILVLIRSSNYRLHPSSPSLSSSHYSSRLIANAEAIIDRLQRIFAAQITTVDITVERVLDLLQLPYEDQVRLVHSASIVIAMNGAEVATSSIHMPIGTRYCCGVVEIFPDSSNSGGGAGGKVGYSQLARRLGHVYQRMDIVAGSGSRNSSAGSGSVVPVDQLEGVVMNVYQQIIQSKGSCFLSDVLQSPYL